MKVNQLRAGVIMTYLNIGLGSLSRLYIPRLCCGCSDSLSMAFTVGKFIVGYFRLSFGWVVQLSDMWQNTVRKEIKSRKKK